MTERQTTILEIKRLQSAIAKSHITVVEFSRLLVHTLRDAKQESTAKELERLLFECDVASQEAVKFTEENLPNLLKDIFGRSDL